MSLSRREFLEVLAVAAASGLSFPGLTAATPLSVTKTPSDFYEIPNYGNVSLLHFTDCHAQLLPVWFREPHINIGVAGMLNKAPHLVGEHLIKQFNLQTNSRLSHAHTYLNFIEAAKQYGKVGGFAHLATLVNKIRAQRPGALLLDGGDTWQGSATSLWTNGQDMVDACLLLGVDIMTAHWEFTFGAERVKEIVNEQLQGKIDFVAQNIIDNEWEEAVFTPYVIKQVNGVKVAIIGQAFPYTPIANPRHFVPDWSFGIREDELQATVNKAKKQGAQVIVLLSHNGMDVDLKLASRIRGIHAILGGHTHDAVPAPIQIKNPEGKATLVINSGSNGKFLTTLDFSVKNGQVKGHQCKIIPVFSNLLPADPKMSAYIEKVRAPYQKKLTEKLAVTDDLLYRRGNFNGTFDQVILDAMMEHQETEIAFSPGFRWGTTKLPGETITFEDVMTQTAITYPTVTRNELTGERIKLVLEDVADNLFNKDPYYQQGGDMVRVGGLKYTLDPNQEMGHRISHMELNGKPIDAKKKYSVAGWASVQPEVKENIAIWDLVAEYLRDKRTINVKELNQPQLINVKNNPGFAKPAQSNQKEKDNNPRQNGHS